MKFRRPQVYGFEEARTLPSGFSKGKPALKGLIICSCAVSGCFLLAGAVPPVRDSPSCIVDVRLRSAAGAECNDTNALLQFASQASEAFECLKLHVKVGCSVVLSLVVRMTCQVPAALDSIVSLHSGTPLPPHSISLFYKVPHVHGFCCSDITDVRSLVGFVAPLDLCQTMSRLVMSHAAAGPDTPVLCTFARQRARAARAVRPWTG